MCIYIYWFFMCIYICLSWMYVYIYFCICRKGIYVSSISICIFSVYVYICIYVYSYIFLYVNVNKHFYGLRLRFSATVCFTLATLHDWPRYATLWRGRLGDWCCFKGMSAMSMIRNVDKDGNSCQGLLVLLRRSAIFQSFGGSKWSISP